MRCKSEKKNSTPCIYIYSLAPSGSRRRGLLPPSPLLLGDGQEQLELRGQFLLRVQAVGEIDATNTTVGVDLHSQSLDVVRPVRSPRKVAEVKLDLVPPLLPALVYSGGIFF